MNFSVQAGFIDYQAIADVVAKGLNDAGVNAKVTASAPDSVDGQKKTGDFQLMLEYLHGGCELAKNIGAKLSSKQIPTTTDIFPNVERFSDPAVDEAVEEPARSRPTRTSQKDVPRRPRRHDDDEVPGHLAHLRPGPHHLPHRQGRRLAERAEPVRQPARTTGSSCMTHLTAPK